MKPYLHSRSSAKKYGGKWEDYQDIHDFMDSTKAAVADVRHRVVLHSAFGCFVVEKVFGVTRTNSEGKVYSVRDVAEDHVLEDLGFIPTLEKWLEGMKVEEWMGGPSKKKSFIPFEEEIPTLAPPLPLLPTTLPLYPQKENFPQYPDFPHGPVFVD